MLPRLQRPVAGTPARAPGRRRRRRHARGSVGARPPPAPAARSRLRRSRVPRVGVARRREGGGPPGREVLLTSTEQPGAAPFRAELLRYLARAGLPAEPFDGRPEPWAAGLRGDWRTAAAGWVTAGDPYEQALELVESGEPEPTTEGLRILDGLGAAAAAALARERLRGLGLTVPRRPRHGARQSRRPHGASAGRARADQRGVDQRRDRRPARRLRPDRRPPRRRGAPRSCACARGGRRPPRRTSLGSTSNSTSRPIVSGCRPEVSTVSSPPRVSIASVSRSPSEWETSSFTGRPVTVSEPLITVLPVILTASSPPEPAIRSGPPWRRLGR